MDMDNSEMIGGDSGGRWVEVVEGIKRIKGYRKKYINFF